MNPPFIFKNLLIERSINLCIVAFIIASLIFKLSIFNIMFLNQSLLVLIGLTITLVICLVMRNQLPLNNYVSKNTLFLIAIFIFIILNSFLIRSHLQLGAIFSLFIGAAFGKQISESKKSSWLFLIPFWFLAIFIVHRLLQNPDPNHVFIRSRNYISFYLLITVLPYYFIKLKNSEKFSLVPAIILLVLSMYSLGRSGILSALILFIGLILHPVKKLKFKITLILSITLLLGSVLFFFIEYFNLYLEYERFSNFENISTIGGRTDFLSNYLNHLDFFGVVYGVDTNNPKILLQGGSYLASHIHSSILNFISVIGILFFAFIYFLIKKMKIFANYNSTINFLIIALLVRVSTEDGLLFDFFDYTIWMFFFISAKQFSKLSSYNQPK